MQQWQSCLQGEEAWPSLPQGRASSAASWGAGSRACLLLPGDASGFHRNPLLKTCTDRYPAGPSGAEATGLQRALPREMAAGMEAEQHSFPRVPLWHCWHPAPTALPPASRGR